ncbi:MAG: uracil-DNA glycosylase [Candidatus Freyarchaeota archaeon]|nr:uracil-DNA glycosylase [Candidatus Freyrarchaeum guaymaensis]
MELEELKAKAERCRKCPLWKGRKNVVFGEGNPQAEVMLIGEAPGREEDVHGKPFVGRAGQLLNRVLLKAGIRREEVYITNVVKCRPPRNRAPRKSEVEACMEYLSGQISLIRPKLIVLLGGVALKWVVGEKRPVTSLRGKPIVKGDVTFLPTLHPASALYNPRNEKLIEEDMATLKRIWDRLKTV